MYPVASANPAYASSIGPYDECVAIGPVSPYPVMATDASRPLSAASRSGAMPSEAAPRGV